MPPKIVWKSIIYGRGFLISIIQLQNIYHLVKTLMLRRFQETHVNWQMKTEKSKIARILRAVLNAIKAPSDMLACRVALFSIIMLLCSIFFDFSSSVIDVQTTFTRRMSFWLSEDIQAIV